MDLVNKVNKNPENKDTKHSVEQPKHLIGTLVDSEVVAEFNDFANELFNKGYGYQEIRSYLVKGKKIRKKLIIFNDVETLYLVRRAKLVVKKSEKSKKELDELYLIRHFSKYNKDINIMYKVYEDLRNRGYIVKTGLKFGSEFRVYPKGKKPGEAHAKWICFSVRESDRFRWHDFAAKNRVAHSTKKKLMIAIVDNEGDITYYEIRWLRP